MICNVFWLSNKKKMLNLLKYIFCQKLFSEINLLNPLQVSPNIIKFFDKRLITPITKFFLWFTETTKTKGKNFEKILSMKSSLVIISLLISVFIFFYVDTKSTTILETSAEVLYKQKVNAIYNEESYVIEGIPESVDITMIGRKSDLYLAKQLPIDAVDIDLKDLVYLQIYYLYLSLYLLLLFLDNIYRRYYQ